MPLDPQLRGTLEQVRGMLRNLQVRARSANLERMVYLIDLALNELASGQAKPPVESKQADPVCAPGETTAWAQREEARTPRERADTQH